ncbi:4'-phosphopantetheinyl transferase superfamily protein [uncultured Polaribacter sp.]|uniref:4'-phosphopantetheinyl transferase family protein n=1 Tax=uncultured Polaribacter sp. TaxID=174711 RepID=UPI00260FDFE9|nr:4'-phosphopantetheinyl transferase superfamily protein [uncultured Polaribacter sp.]
MLRIGNDIVDLKLAKTQSNWQRKGFLEKQFTQKEQQEIWCSKNPFFKVWQFWSMKEAAYKCYTQKVEKRFFAPQKFECFLLEKEKGFVVFENSKFYTTSFLDEFYVHTIASDILLGNNTTLFLGIDLPKNIGNNIKLKLSEKKGIVFEEIEKRKTVIGAPLFYHQEKLLTNSCSISHHGNYGAFIFTAAS